MMKTPKTPRTLAHFALALGAAGLLCSCSTVSRVTSAVNPFDGAAPEKVKEDPSRISILSLTDKLELTGTMSSADIRLPPTYTNTDWPQVGGYADHAPQRTNASGPLKKVWSRGFGKGSNRQGRVVAPPVIGGGRLFVMDANNRIVAMDADTGKKLWDYKVKVKKVGKTRTGRTSIEDRFSDPLSFRDQGGEDKEAVGGGVALAGGRAFATTGFGVIVALDAVSGEQIWRAKANSPLHSAPTVADGRVFAITDDNELYAFDAQTGEVLWTYQAIIESARMLTAPAVAVVDNVVIAPFSSGEIVALRVQNGAVLWQDALSASGTLTPLAKLNDIAAGPVVADGYVIASAQSGALGAFDLRTGQRVWSQPAGSLGFPAVAGDFLYVVTTEGQLACLSKTDGTVIWITQLPAYRSPKKRKDKIAWFGPIFAGPRLLVMGSHGRALDVNLYDGQVVREIRLPGSVMVPPIVANNRVFFVTDEAKVVALQ